MFRKLAVVVAVNKIMADGVSSFFYFQKIIFSRNR